MIECALVGRKLKNECKEAIVFMFIENDTTPETIANCIPSPWRHGRISVANVSKVVNDYEREGTVGRQIQKSRVRLMPTAQLE
jgi:hypothetical protein